MPVMKPDGSVRICGDYKLTVNQVVELNKYPLPKVDELFSTLSGGKFFTKLDLSQAYLQLPVEKGSRKFLTINTHRGLFEYTRLPFGISSAPGIFQRTIESLLRGIDGVSVYLDDILITGKSEEEHLANVDRVLSILGSAGLKLNKGKSKFCKQSVEYLGFVIDQDGLHTLPTKVSAIREAKQPTNVSELRAFLGMINYYSKFLQNLATKLAPLYELLCKEVSWKWGPDQQEAFEKAKSSLQC